MDVTAYSRQKQGKKKLTAHFRVEEFACKDGSDTVLVSKRLCGMLEQLRKRLGCTVNVNSGYRTAAHNRRIGGSSQSKHCRGLAADIICKRDGRTVSAEEVCCAAQLLGFPGIAYITKNATHVDVRESGRFWADESRNNAAVTDFHLYFGRKNPYPCPKSTVKRGSKGDGVKWVQFQLNKAGETVAVDGACGAKTEQAIKRFQVARGLAADGKAGKLTRAALKGV